jgi:serine/threonine protein phosphatase PrpC
LRFRILSKKGQGETSQDFATVNNIKMDYKLSIIADGMGGYELGETTAKMVSGSIIMFLSNAGTINAEIIQIAFNKANLAVKQFKEDTGKKP